jgi:Zn-dependent protease
LLAAIAAGAFYASLLAHELAHAVVARRQGTPVEGITLWLFGGVAQLRGEAASPGDEARTTGAGLAVTVGLTVLFGGLTAVLLVAGATDVVVAVPAWLTFMNALLAVFNAIPALPLDGGRLLHAALWRRRGSRDGATLTAARLGRGFGIVLIAGGALAFAALGLYSGLWLALIGWFLMGAASAEAARVRIGASLHGLRVRDVMAPVPGIVPGWLTVDAFAGHLDPAAPLGPILVGDVGGRVVGMVSLRRLAGVPRGSRGAVRLQDVAIDLKSLPSASPDEPLLDLVGRMRTDAEGRALVFEEGRLVGIVSTSDIARAAGSAGLGGRPPFAAGALPPSLEPPRP